MPERPSSKHESTLKRLGFKEIGGRELPGGFLKNPVFVNVHFLEITIVVDETGRFWCTQKIIDMEEECGFEDWSSDADRILQ